MAVYKFCECHSKRIRITRTKQTANKFFPQPNCIAYINSSSCSSSLRINSLVCFYCNPILYVLMMSERIEFNVKVFTKQIFHFINVALVSANTQFVFSFQFASEFHCFAFESWRWRRMKTNGTFVAQMIVSNLTLLLSKYERLAHFQCIRILGKVFDRAFIIHHSRAIPFATALVWTFFGCVACRKVLKLIAALA